MGLACGPLPLAAVLVPSLTVLISNHSDRSELTGSTACQSIITRLLQEAAQNPAHQMEIEDFLTVANAFGVEGPEIDRLRLAV